MPSYLTQTLSKHRRLFLVALIAGGVLGGALWTWGTPHALPDPFAQRYSESELAQRIERGAAVFTEQNCVECHTTSLPAPDAAGIGLKGPSLVGIVGETVTLESGRIVARDHRYLRRAIRDSRADVVKGYTFQVMPDYSHLEDDDVVALLLYLRSLGDGEGGGGLSPSGGSRSVSE